MINITIPESQYIGVRLSDNTDNLPLAFLTPGGTDKPAQKRAKTVDNWIGKDYSPYFSILHAEIAQFEKDNPDAILVTKHDPADYHNDTYCVPNKENVNYKILDNVINEAQFGFKITEAISRGRSWNGTANVVRIEDPRGFELEISVDNLVKIMSMSTFVDGVCQEKCIWARQGSVNILLPINSEPYREAIIATTYKNKKSISLRDIKYGDTIEVKETEYIKGCTGVYYGMYRLYGLAIINANDDSLWPSDSTNMIVESKRYLVFADGEYKMYKSLKVQEVLESVTEPIERKSIDPALIHNQSWACQDQGTIFAVLPKAVKIDDILSGIEMKKLDQEITRAALNELESGKYHYYTTHADGSLLQFHRSYMYNQKKVDLDYYKLFEGLKCDINRSENKWSYSTVIGHGGKGPWAMMKSLNPLNEKKGLLISDYEWSEMQFRIAGTVYKVPLVRVGY